MFPVHLQIKNNTDDCQVFVKTYYPCLSD